jgi:hypothetical protein
MNEYSNQPNQPKNYVIQFLDNVLNITELNGSYIIRDSNGDNFADTPLVHALIDTYISKLENEKLLKQEIFLLKMERDTFKEIVESELPQYTQGE